MKIAFVLTIFTTERDNIDEDKIFVFFPITVENVACMWRVQWIVTKHRKVLYARRARCFKSTYTCIRRIFFAILCTCCWCCCCFWWWWWWWRWRWRWWCIALTIIHIFRMAYFFAHAQTNANCTPQLNICFSRF